MIILGRRAVLATGVLALGGCSLPDQTAPPNPDAALLASVEQAVGAAATAIAQDRAGSRALHAALAGMASVHAAHAERLGLTPTSPGAATVGRPDAVLAAARLREEHLVARLGAAADRADSGDLAALLASMAAGLAQQITLLPRSLA